MADASRGQAAVTHWGRLLVIVVAVSVLVIVAQTQPICLGCGDLTFVEAEQHVVTPWGDQPWYAVGTMPVLLTTVLSLAAFGIGFKLRSLRG